LTIPKNGRVAHGAKWRPQGYSLRPGPSAAAVPVGQIGPSAVHHQGLEIGPSGTKKIQKDWNPESWNVSETLVSTLGGAATPVNECVPLSSIVIATKKKTTVKHPESRENQSFEINPN
jgi:hypothetical protein